jgi:DNA-directed RNA polymerase specialized sigma24 family protein
MSESDWLAEGFEQNRARLRAVAYRMLGSLAEADDAVQEAWLRLGRSDEIAPMVGRSPATARKPWPGGRSRSRAPPRRSGRSW